MRVLLYLTGLTLLAISAGAIYIWWDDRDVPDKPKDLSFEAFKKYIARKGGI